MLNTAIFLLASTASLASAGTLSKRQSTNSTTEAAVVDATYDGQCFYPEPTDNFDLTSYLGRWYQVAGTVAPFNAGCKCIRADYVLNPDGTVNVQNTCEAQGREVNIEGTATPVSQYAGYGHVGVLRVQFPGQPAPECPGPNYIVQDVGGGSGNDDCHGVDASGENSWVIVQASNFSTLFVLSREQNPGNVPINTWLKRAERLGSDLGDVVITDQSGCQFS